MIKLSASAQDTTKEKYLILQVYLCYYSRGISVRKYKSTMSYLGTYWLRRCVKNVVMYIILNIVTG
jgi:hypothetical protein